MRQMLAEGKEMKAEDYLPKIAEDLRIDLKKLQEEYGKKNVQLIEEYEIPYIRFKRDVKDVQEGTVAFIGGEIAYARGFPKIRRAVILESTLKKQMKNKFQVEEKLDGYNVRTIFINDLVCITRKGIVCPYTTSHVKSLLGTNAFFKENPELMLCGEVVGLQNPYQTKSYPEARDFGYFIFDIKDRKSGKSLPSDVKNDVVKKYRLPSVKNFGTFSADEGGVLLDLVRTMGEEKREGIVIKSLDMGRQIKYTSNQSTNNDLRYAFKFFFDYGQPFMFRRLIREAFQAYEMGLSKEQLEKEADELGRSILLPMVETIKAIADDKETTEDFEIAVPDADFGKAFIAHLQHLGVKATIEKMSERAGQTVIKVKRHYPSTNDKTKAYLDGEFSSE